MQFKSDRNLEKGFLGSVVLHLTILIIAIIGLPFSVDKEMPPLELAGVEFVSHLPDLPKDKPPLPEEKKEPQKEELKPLVPPEPEPQPEETKIGALDDNVPQTQPVEKNVTPEPKPVEQTPPPEPMPVLEKKKEEPKPIKPEPKPEIKPQKQVASVKPIQKPKKPNQTKTKEDKEFDDILKSVMDLEESPKPKKGESGGTQAPKGLNESDIQQIARQIEPCWALQETPDVNIRFKVTISKEGRFLNPIMEETYEINSNPVHRSLAEAAHRALLDTKCNDISWLKKKYPEMTGITLHFNPKHMVGY